MIFRTDLPGKWSRMGTGLTVVFLVLSAITGAFAEAPAAVQEALSASGVWVDLYQESNPEHQEWAASVCALVPADALLSDASDLTILLSDAYKPEGLAPCADHPYASQPAAALCSGFAAGEDLIITAGSCLADGVALDSYRFIFGYALTAPSSVVLDFSADQIYTPVEVVAFSDEAGADFALVRVDRPITVAGALPLSSDALEAGQAVFTAAYPSGLPEKLAAASAMSAEAGVGVALAPVGDLSGAPVIVGATGEVAGILSGGAAVSADAPCYGYDPASGAVSAVGFTASSAFSSFVSGVAAEKQAAEGETPDVPAADFTVDSLIRDGEALLPLHDWVPLFRFSMSYGEEPAPRELEELKYRLINDDPEEREYLVRPDLRQSDILEFGLFSDSFSTDTEGNEDRYGALSTDDPLLFTWDATGAPSGSARGLEYSMNFRGRNVVAGPQIDDVMPDGRVYIVAVRTSPTWRSALSMGVEVTMARMVEPRTGVFIPELDSYSPNFYEGEKLEDSGFYSSSFGVYDPTGPDLGGMSGFESWKDIATPNFFQYTPYLSVPLSEFSRPRWNKPDSLISIATGQFMNIRTLMPLESWMPLIGINIHSSRALYAGIDDDYPFAVLQEVNVVLTDNGGDPHGYPGNGGFNPRQALKPVLHGSNDIGSAGSHNVGYNGLWVWRDSNGNGIFDPPTQGVGGFSFNGDEPLASLDPFYGWEHISEPPGGGAPWWKIKLRFAGWRYTAANLPKVPNNLIPGELQLASEFSYDYFVVARLDSGYKDGSGNATGNPGATFGAEFKAMIEPRRFDQSLNRWEGGIYATSQYYRGRSAIPQLVYVWQNEPDWGNEPWWPERTLNANAAKAHKMGLEVVDLVQTYMGESADPQRFEEIFSFSHFPTLLIHTDQEMANTSMGFGDLGDLFTSRLGKWMDPFGLDAARFRNRHAPDVYSFTPVNVGIRMNLLGQSILMGSSLLGLPQFSFETRPFYFDLYDAPPAGPRSSAYPAPAPAPAIPQIDTWPGSRVFGDFPRLSDWSPEHAKARLLTQKVELRSKHVPMLGFNLAGSSDPVVNQEGNGVSLAELHVAFWGPDFTPSVLRPLDPDKNHNDSLASGVLLWQHALDLTGDTPVDFSSFPAIFVNTEEVSYYGNSPLPLLHKIIPVTGLRWGTAPEFIDLDGDGVPDDMNGDGLVDDRDKAWVLTFRPTNNWQVPQTDIAGTPSGGLDLILSVKTSDTIARFQKFRAVVPSTLPERSADKQKAGIQFWPQVNTGPRAYIKAHGEEGPVQPYYGHDMLEANVPAAVVDMTQRWTDLNIGGSAVPLLGLDLATNTKSTRATGQNGTGREKSFHVPGASWAADIYAGDVLVDGRYESYEILGNSGDTLYLLSGKPLTGAWRIVQNPTYLEEVMVELYQEGTHNTFNPLTDLLPLDIDQQVSGVALYRDNDNHPANRNGVFDPDIDIPLSLDCPPRFFGQTGDTMKVRFCFSLPGTGDFPKARDRQPRNRQWIYDGFGAAGADYESGPDFFVVVRASNEMHVGDQLRAGIVSWGPATPTEPDPHIWASLPGEDRHDYKKFREFLWAERGLGFVSYFKEPPLYYFLDANRAGQRPDNSGYNWIRSHSAVKARSGVVTARKRPVSPRSLSIDSVSQRVLPVQTLPGQPFDFLIQGKNFGTEPMVGLSGYAVTVLRAANEELHVAIETRDGIIPQSPVTLVIRNPQTGDEMSRSDLFTLGNTVTVNGPKIFGVFPNKVRKEDFPVVLKGANFAGNDFITVHFGETMMPILDVSADGTAMKIGWPQGGLPVPGKLNVSVRAQGANGGQAVLVDGVEYINPEIRNKAGLLGCGPDAARGTSGRNGDLLLLAILGSVLFAMRRRAVRITLPLLLLLLFAAAPGHAFFPKGGWNFFQQLRFATWAMHEFDTDGNGTVDKGEGLEFRIESGPRGFTPAEVEAVRAAFDTWENVPSSYVAFRFAGAIEDPILPAAVGADYLPMVYMQVTDVSSLDGYGQPDETDFLVPGLDSFQPALTFVLYTIDATVMPVGNNAVMVPAGTILDCDIVVNASLHRPGLLAATTFGVLDLQSTVTHQVGQLLGLSFTPLNNLDPFNSVTLPGAAGGLPVEPAVLQLTGADGLPHAIGATPTMFPIYFLSESSYGDYTGGWRDLAPDDISGISWLYPRKDGQSNFFSIAQEAWTHVRRTTGIPPQPVSGAHVVAWASLSGNDSDQRVPLFSTMTGFYQRHESPQLSGRFALHGLWKQMEVPGRSNEFYEPSYVMTINPLNGIGYDRQAPPGMSASDFDSLQGDFPISYTTSPRPADFFSTNYPSEVYHEDGNIYGMDNNSVGTPLAWSFEKNTVVSKISGKTLPHLLPTNVPMFGDPDTVCPMNIIENPDGIGDIVTDGGTIPTINSLGGSGGGTGGLRGFNNKLRAFRDDALLQSALGTALVDGFYRVSPFLSRQLQQHGILLSMARSVTELLAALLETTGWWFLALVAVPGILFTARKRFLKAAAVTAVLLLLLFVPVMAHAGQLPVPTQDLVAKAQVIVTGKIESTQTRFDRNNRIFTDVVLKVQDVVKGNVNRGSNLTFTVIGGIYGSLAMTVPGLPNFTRDEQVLLYLVDYPGYGLMPFGGLRSKVNIFLDETSGEEVLDMSRDDPEVNPPAETKALPATEGEEAEAGGEPLIEESSERMPVADYLDFLRGLVRNQRIR